VQFHIWMCGIISAEFSVLLHMWDIYKLSTFEWKYLCNSQNANVIPKHTKPKQTSITVKTSLKFSLRYSQSKLLTEKLFTWG